jgi:hypothetical protein
MEAMIDSNFARLFAFASGGVGEKSTVFLSQTSIHCLYLPLVVLGRNQLYSCPKLPEVSQDATTERSSFCFKERSNEILCTPKNEQRFNGWEKGGKQRIDEKKS